MALLAAARDAASLVLLDHDDLDDCGLGSVQLLHAIAAATVAAAAARSTPTAAPVAAAAAAAAAGSTPTAAAASATAAATATAAVAAGRRADNLLRLARQQLHAHPYQDVPCCWRRLFTDASIVKAVALILDRPFDSDPEPVVHALDMALIMAGAPGKGRRAAIERLLQALDDRQDDCCPDDTPSPAAKRLKLDPTSSPPPARPEVRCPVPRRDRMSLEAFQRHLDGASTPVVIAGALAHWPALGPQRAWASPAYLLSRTHGGRRLVPVELGRAYTDPAWRQAIIPFRVFLATHILAAGAGPASATTTAAAATGYLAQHNLFSQVPALRDDIAIPDYCYATPPPRPPAAAAGAGQPLHEPAINAWFGPRGTISPLHTDPHANILAQVVGSKYVRLYGPDQTARVFPRGVDPDTAVDMANTSRAEVEAADGCGGEALGADEKREWARACYVDTVLQPGEALYIPAGWWHYVRSLDVSFSVSFWWD